MKDTHKKQLYKNMESFHLPTYMEIPNVGLYLEQTSKYIMDYLQVLPGVTLTGSMISNYVKKKMIHSTRKKMYDREQIAYLFFIAIAKSVLTLEDVQLMIDLQKETCSWQEAYTYFCTEMEASLKNVFAEKDSDVHNLDNEEQDGTEERELLKKMIAAVAHKVYIDKYLEMLRTENDN